jgi:hypothetical protein
MIGVRDQTDNEIDFLDCRVKGLLLGDVEGDRMGIGNSGSKVSSGFQSTAG